MPSGRSHWPCATGSAQDFLDALTEELENSEEVTLRSVAVQKQVGNCIQLRLPAAKE